MTQFNEFQTIKRRFFAMRNGIIADRLRKAGSPYKIIFGLNLPQIDEIASATPHTMEIASALWQNTSTRESMLMAPMVVPRGQFTIDMACEWIDASLSQECSDVLCHKLLKHLPYRNELIRILMDSDSTPRHYTAMRLLWHSLASDPAACRALADSELRRNDPTTSPLARQIIDELDFIASL